jgi:outer membrane biosynthesis protein TonB
MVLKSNMGNKKTIITVITLVIFAVVTVFIAMRLYQLRQQSVAPNAPESKPKADVIPISCQILTFSLSPTFTPTPTPTAAPTRTPTPTPTAAPTRTPTPTPTAAPTTQPTATSTPTPELTSTPTPELTSTPTPTPRQTATATPNSPTQTPSLPDAGISTPTTLGIIIGVALIIISLALAL